MLFLDEFSIADNSTDEKPKTKSAEQELMIVKKKKNFLTLMKLLIDFIPSSTLSNLKFIHILSVFVNSPLKKSPEKLEVIVEKIEKNNNFKRDPNDLVMIERNDFTNYLVFFDEYQNNDFLLEKFSEFNPLLKELSFEQKDERKKYILRYFYFIIYEVYTANFEQETNNEISEKIKQREEEEKFSGNIFEDPNEILKPLNEDMKKDEEIKGTNIEEQKNKGEKMDQTPEKEEGKKMEWEIDDKLLIFS